jgi:hypothetical protein
MPHSSNVVHSLALLGIALGAVACSTPTDPFTTGPGHADVMGLVTTAAGAPVAATTVRIACTGVSAVVVTTDSTGRYASGLYTSDHAFFGMSGRLSCSFSEPAAGPIRAQTNVKLGFARGPVLVVLQMVNLQEQ